MKPLCIDNGILFPRTHDISFLIDMLCKAGLDVPERVQEARYLTEFAVETRYPGIYDPVTEVEYKEALEMAENVVKWVDRLLL